jgi:opacity protein-like surface antigen
MMATRRFAAHIAILLVGLSLSIHAKSQETIGQRLLGSDDPDRGLYVSLLAGSSSLEGSSGGFNTVGSFRNFGGGEDEETVGGFAVGCRLPTRRYGGGCFARLELEGIALGDRDFTTGSFPGPPGPPNFLYDVQVDDMQSGIVNLLFDIPIRENFGVYLGSGLGGVNYDLSVDDGVVRGSDEVSAFAIQYAFGVNLYLTERLALDLGWRHTEYGKADIALTDISSPSISAGNYKLNMSAENLFVTLRYDLF